jgi:hypothetical protein
MTVVFTNLRISLEPETDRLPELMAILEELRACGAIGRFLAELPIHVTWSNTEQVKKALRDLQTAGFISGYVSGQGVSQVEAFKRWVFR